MGEVIEIFPAMTALHFLISIQRAEEAGFHAVAAALREIYNREFPQSP